jgi:hypothetical protein
MSRNLRETVSAYTNSFRRNNYGSQFYSALAVGIGTLASLIIGRAAWKDYELFLSYGPGGVPYNPLGWLVANILRTLRINMIDVRKFETDPDQRSWLNGENWSSAKRPGSRPHTGPHPIPQRQLDQHPSKEIQQKFLSSFKSLGEDNPNLVKFELSQYERHTDAIWVVDECPCYALGKDSGYTREISHIHTNTDYSAHVVLSPRDAAQVIRSGWGQLHGLAGVSVLGRRVVPATYVLLYSPRNDDEIRVLTEIIRAGIGYMTDSTEVKAPA